MMMTIVPAAVRRARRRGKVRLIVLAVGMGLAGGAWATARSPSSYALQVVDVRTGRVVTRASADSAIRSVARALADGLYALADSVPNPPPPPGAPVAEPAPVADIPASGEREGLQIEITEAWATPGSREVMPMLALADQE